MNKNIYNQVSTTKIVWNILHSYGFKLFAFCFLCLIGASSWAADTYIYRSDTRITLDSPSFKVKFRYYDADGNNAYWTDPPQLYINGEYVCTLDCIPTGNDGDDKAKEVRPIDGDWVSYETSDYYIVLINPHLSTETTKDPVTSYDVYVEVLPKYIDTERSNYNIKICGNWRTNHVAGIGDGTFYRELSCNIDIDRGIFSSKKGTFTRPTDKVIQYNVNDLKQPSKDYKYGFYFYDNDDYKKELSKTILPEKVLNTENLVRITGMSNTTDYTFYTRQTLENDSISYGKSGKTGKVKFYRNEGKSDLIKGFYSPKNLSLAPSSQWDKSVYINWEITNSKKDKDGKWHVYRKNGKYNNTEEYTLLAKLDALSYTDESAELNYNKEYTYKVAFVPSEWTQEGGTMAIASDLSTYNKEPVKIKFENNLFSNFNITAGETEATLRWNVPGFPNSNYKIKINRRLSSLNDDAWETIHEIPVTNPKETDYEWTDKTLNSPCDVYDYLLSVNTTDSVFTSSIESGKLTSTTTITEVKASYGDYADMVRIHWKVKQVGTAPSTFEVYRRMLGDETSQWTKIHTIVGTNDSYSYEDLSATPGEYYEYRVQSSITCDPGPSNTTYKSTDGFAMATGSVSGRITYGTGMAVKGAKVRAVLAADADYTPKNSQFHSLMVSNVNGGITLPIDKDKAKTLASEDGSFSTQMWFRIGSKSSDTPMLLDVYNNFSIWAKRDSTEGGWNMMMRVPGTNSNYQDVDAGMHVTTDVFYHLTYTYERPTNTWTLYLTKDTAIIAKHTFQAGKGIDLTKIPESKRAIAFGTNISKLDQYMFNGFIDDIRWWRKALTEEEILRNYGRQLAGYENDLALYWPLNENINGQTTAYDYSKTNDIANGMHGNIGPGSKPMPITAPYEELSICNYTNEEGEYTITGIPLLGEGVTYDIIPSMGIHRFSTEKEPLFISKNSIEHSSIDFMDVSSFKVEGVVYYENTRHPVEGCKIKIDGEGCVYNNREAKTDSEGRFTISVPIGEHYITIEKQGHTFENGGRYPADPDSVGLTHNFDREINGLSFTDVTKATVVGRVCGGNIQAAMPMVFGKSVANIGQAVITLQPEKDCKMNVVEIQDELSSQIVNNKDSILYTNPQDTTIRSIAYVKGGNDEDVKTIVITTDPKSGEFIAELPPVPYKVVSVVVPQHPDSTNLFSSSLPRLDASNMLQSTTDELIVSIDDTLTCEYNASLVMCYRSQPVLEVTDTAHIDGAFGEINAEVHQLDGSVESQATYTKDAVSNTIKYKFGYPVYITGNRYGMFLKAYEMYTNHDNDNLVNDTVPLSGVGVQISNEFDGQTLVWAANDTLATPGQIEDIAETDMELSTLGTGRYAFLGGLPNIQGDHTLTMNIVYEVDGVTYSWRPTDDPFKALVLGGLPTGSNFVTEGPSEIIGVLRDPPGSNSYSMWEKGTVIERDKYSQIGFGLEDLDFRAKFKLGMSIKAAAGAPGLYNISIVDAIMDIDIGLTTDLHFVAADYDLAPYCNIKKTTTFSKSISTSSSSDFVGANGDVFVGNSTNLTFGEEREVGLYQISNDSIIVDTKDIVSVGQSFDTHFAYTQYYIENTLIPNLKLLRNDVLLPRGTEVNVTNLKEAKFVSKLDPTHPNYGTSNSDKKAWGEQASDSTDGPSYTYYAPKNVTTTDSILYYNEQIALWEKHLEDNESAKVTAIKSNEPETNISFDGGTVYEHDFQYKNATEGHRIDLDYKTLINFGVEKGGEFNETTGFIFRFNFNLGPAAIYHDEDLTFETKGSKYVLADAQFTDAFSVDVYGSPDQTSPIFYTRGGQSSCPYEGAVYTKYHQEGTIISQPTMQIEVPKLYCENNMQTGIPAGGKAYFTLELQNNSEIDCDTWYNLSVVEESNPHGAQLLVDGLGVARSYKINGGKSIIKTLTLEQGDPSVFDYENIKIRLSSQCQADPTGVNGEIADTISLSAYFVPTCSDIRLHVLNPTLNSNTGAVLNLVVDAYDLNHKNLRGIELQYKVEGDEDWTVLEKYVTHEEYKVNNEILLEEPEINYSFDMTHLPDQNYLFRAITICGAEENPVNNETPEELVVKDMSKPTLIALPSPTDGIYNIGDEISVVFNEEIRDGGITKDNISVKGVLHDAIIEHKVAFQSNGTSPASTESTFDLYNNEFTIGLWMNYSAPGTILSHGTTENNFKAEITPDNLLMISVAGKDTIVSKTQMKPNTWLYLNISVEPYNETHAKINASCAFDAESRELIKEGLLATHYGRGVFNIGGSMIGAIHDVTLWNHVRSAEKAFSSMYNSFAPYTSGLIGYWKMTEGKGLIAHDSARNRHMAMPSNNSWFLNSPNISMHLPEDGYANVNISNCPMSATDDFLVELWFKGDKSIVGQDTLRSSVLAIGDSILDIRTKPSRLGYTIEIETKGNTKKANVENSLDQSWHHIALNVLNGTKGTSTLYYDGEVCTQFNAGELPPLAYDQITLGARMTINSNGDTTYSQTMKNAAFDELRIWKGTYSAGFIRENMHKRVDNDLDGLVAYYPFEKNKLDEYGQPIMEPDASDYSKVPSSIPAKIFTNTGKESTDWSSETDVPSLQSTPLQQNVPFSFVASNRKIAITPTADLAQMEGTTLTISLKGIYDSNNNIAENITWTALVRQNPLNWIVNEMNLSKNVDESLEFHAEISNNGTETEYWRLDGIPVWLEVNNETGTLLPGEKVKLNFNVLSSAGIGRHETVIYLVGNNNINTALNIQLTVTGDKPNWNVNPAAYEHSMAFIGKLHFINGISNNPDNIVAAFVKDTICVGVASPTYVKRYDTYFVMMSIYGNEPGQKIHFKAYDANQGIIHHSLIASKNKEKVDIYFTTGKASEGSFDEPITLTTTGEIEQVIKINKGWTWLSLNVEKLTGSTPNAVLKPLNCDSTTLLKGKLSYTQYNVESGEWEGELDTMKTTEMYKLKYHQSTSLPVVGRKVFPNAMPIEVDPAWNWIGYIPQNSMSIADALASLNPQDGDWIKNQYDFAVFDSYEWQGTLKAMTPGEGYLFYSSMPQTRTLTYPEATVAKSRIWRMSDTDNTETLRNSDYPNSMNVIAVVMDGETVIHDAKVYVYADEELRGQSMVTQKDDRHFITIHGEDNGAKLRFEVDIDGKRMEIANPIYFAKDVLVGSPSQPYLIQLDNTTSIDCIHISNDDDWMNIVSDSELKSVDIYGLEGRKVYSGTSLGTMTKVKIQHFVSGVYVIVLKTEDGKVFTLSLVK